MHYASFIAAFFLPAIISAGCDNRGTKNGGNNCNWYGEAPYCGSSSFRIGDWDDNQRMLSSTEEWSASALLNGNYITESCYNAYGAGCYRGYKRLWCYEDVRMESGNKKVDSTHGQTEDERVPFDQEVFGDQKAFRSSNSRFFIDVNGRKRTAEVAEDAL